MRFSNKIDYLKTVMEHLDGMFGEMTENEWKLEMADIQNTLEVMGDMAESLQWYADQYDTKAIDKKINAIVKDMELIKEFITSRGLSEAFLRFWHEQGKTNVIVFPSGGHEPPPGKPS